MLRQQKRQTTIAEVRDHFDDVLEAFTDLADRISERSCIINLSDFEEAAVMIQQQRQKEISASLREVATTINNRVSTDSTPEESKRAWKRRKLGISKMVHYLDTRFGMPASVLLESCLLMAAYALDERHKVMLPVNLENQMFFGKVVSMSLLTTLIARL